MKKMKKQMTAGLLMVLMLVVSVFGNVVNANAATLTAKQYLSKMEKVYSKAKSVEMTQSTSVNMKMMGQEITSKVSGSGIIFFNSAKAKYVQKVTTSMPGQKTNQTVTMYVKKSKGKLYMYTSTDGKTYEKTALGDMDDFTSQLGQVSTNTSTYSKAKIVKESVKVGKVNTVQISYSITGEDMQSAVNQVGLDKSTLDEMGFDFSTMKPIKVTYWIDKKTYRPVKCSVDMTDFMSDFFDVLSAAMTEDEQAGFSSTNYDLKCTKAKSTVTYKNFNKAKSFSYPKAVK